MYTRKILASAAVVLALPALASAARAQGTPADTLSYFPLKTGNDWVYERSAYGQKDRWHVRVAERLTEEDGSVHFALDGYFGPRRMVRASLDGSIVGLTPDGKEDGLWYLLDYPEGGSWQLRLDPGDDPLAQCIDRSEMTLASRKESIQVPAGSFRDVIRVDFGSMCLDAGIVSEWFAPGVGLVRRVETSFAGPIVSELAQAEVGDLVLPSLGYSSSLSLDSDVYFNVISASEAIPTVQATFVLRSGGGAGEHQISFAGCRSVSLTVVDEKGEQVLKARGVDGGDCLAENILRVPPNDQLVLRFSFGLETEDRKPLHDGRYGVIATLDSLDAPPLRPSVGMTIEVRTVRVADRLRPRDFTIGPLSEVDGSPSAAAPPGTPQDSCDDLPPGRSVANPGGTPRIRRHLALGGGCGAQP